MNEDDQLCVHLNGTDILVEINEEFSPSATQAKETRKLFLLKNPQKQRDFK